MVIHHASITLNKTSTYFECKLQKKTTTNNNTFWIRCQWLCSIASCTLRGNKMFRTASIGMNRSRAVMVPPRTADDYGVIKLKLRAVRSQSVAGLHYIYLTAERPQTTSERYSVAPLAGDHDWTDTCKDMHVFINQMSSFYIVSS